MAVLSPGFHGRQRGGAELPPGQYLERGFPVLSAGPTPRVATDTWQLDVVTETNTTHSWTWEQLLALPQEPVTADLHCVTKWSKLGTGWLGVSVDAIFENVDTAADFVMVGSYGGYTTNVPLQDLLDGQAWIVHRYDDDDLEPVHGGPARLLVPHLYLWKSAKWVRRFDLMLQDEPGFWESLGYHNYGDPWREQRYAGD